MLIDFQFTNYKSFKNTAELDMTAAKVAEYPHHIVNVAGEKILRTAAIYGANASGKSNVYNALEYMKYYVLSSFSFGGDGILEHTENKTDYIPVQPFLFDTESKSADTTFEVWFTLPGDEKEYSYNYGFSLNKGSVVEEWLNYRSKTGREYKPVFQRKREQVEYFTIPKKQQENLAVSLNTATLIVSLGAKLRIETLEKIYKWFLSVSLLNFGNPIENIWLSRRLPRGFVESSDVRKKVAEYLNTFDPSISDFIVEKSYNSEGKEGFNIFSVHNTTGSTPIPFESESAGTQKMFTLYSPLQNVLETGGVLFIDELNDRLHPLLVRNFIQTFLDSERNKNNAQLIFTTHDVWHLSSKLFRRDEIWFTEKDKDSTTSLFSLVDIKGENDTKIRNDADILTNYMKGKYGAIPELEKINPLGERH